MEAAAAASAMAEPKFIALDTRGHTVLCDRRQLVPTRKMARPAGEVARAEQQQQQPEQRQQQQRLPTSLDLMQLQLLARLQEERQRQQRLLGPPSADDVPMSRLAGAAGAAGAADVAAGWSLQAAAKLWPQTSTRGGSIEHVYDSTTTAGASGTDSTDEHHDSLTESGTESYGAEEDHSSMAFAGGDACEDEKTTLMVRNVPRMYTLEKMVEMWPCDGSYDILYLPYNCSIQRNLSYAFINFTSPAAAETFRRKWQKARLPGSLGKTPLSVSYADVQGYKNNLKQFHKKRVVRNKMEQCQPIILDGGRRIGLTEALQKLA